MIRKLFYLVVLNMIFLNVVFGSNEISEELKEKVKEKVLYEYENTDVLNGSREFVDKVITDVKVNYFIEKRKIQNINEIEYGNYKKENKELLSDITETEKKKAFIKNQIINEIQSEITQKKIVDFKDSELVKRRIESGELELGSNVNNNDLFKLYQIGLTIDTLYPEVKNAIVGESKKNILDDNIRIRIFMAMNLGQTMMEIFNEKILIEEKKSYYTQSEKKELTEEIKNGKIQAIYLYLFQKNMESNPKLNFLEAFEKIENDYIKKYNLK